ncbi:hypothetical protein CAPTEDRAFT_206715 [Capitella teleta]|uniref:Amiloride-sensitive sodium channel n=1 Tax=Capitella teleta TaxID=283909 RepID=R7TVR8_CAPTE|nr:hypothetical protein CAPTEDRAFT_206715 [Capitella teleta]|eukprot:ELT97682.1 hypothetical protein CAPTEDRAFT_206715 [Capitella teleta]
MVGWWQDVVKVTKNSLLLTTIKGVNRYFKSEYTFLKVWWLLCIGMLFVVAVWQVNDAFQEFLSRDTIVTIKDSELGQAGMNHPITFPAATLCNMKPVHGAKNEKELFDYFMDVDKNISSLAKQRPLTTDDQSTLSELKTAAAFFQFLGKEKAKQYVQVADNFLVDCVVTSDTPVVAYNCSDVGEIRTVQIPDYFSCFIIYIPPDMFSKIRPRKITAILNLDADDNYINPGTLESDMQESGAIATISSAIQVPDFAYSSIRIQPGTNMVINMALTLRLRLENPYGDCTPPSGSNLSFAYSSIKIPYTKISCEEACRQTEVTKACQCFSADTKAVFDMNQTQDFYCAGAYPNFDERFNKLKCSIEAMKSAKIRCLEACTRACEELQVSTVVSSSTWPRSSQLISFYNTYIDGQSFADSYAAYKEIEKKYLNTGNVSDTLDKLRKETTIPRNFAKVELKLSSTQITTISDEIKVTELSILSTIASLMNMYSGHDIIERGDWEKDLLTHSVSIVDNRRMVSMTSLSPLHRIAR